MQHLCATSVAPKNDGAWLWTLSALPYQTWRVAWQKVLPHDQKNLNANIFSALAIRWRRWPRHGKIEIWPSSRWQRCQPCASATKIRAGLRSASVPPPFRTWTQLGNLYATVPARNHDRASQSSNLVRTLVMHQNLKVAKFRPLVVLVLAGLDCLNRFSPMSSTIVTRKIRHLLCDKWATT